MESMAYVKRFECGGVAEVSEDFTLPDYVPEVRRVVGVRATSGIDGKYLSGDELEAEGAVTYTVLYITGDGALSQVSESCQWRVKMPLKGQMEGVTVGDIAASCSVDSAVCRVTAPRKFTLSSRVKVSAWSEKPADVTPSWDAEVHEVRVLEDTAATASVKEYRRSGEVSGQYREREGAALIMAWAAVSAFDIRIDPAAGEAVVKGQADLNMLLSAEDVGYFISRGRAPIEEHIPMDKAGEKCRCTAFANPVLLEAEVAEDGGVSWTVEYDVDLVSMEEQETRYAKDAYLTSCGEKLTREDMGVYSPALITCGRLTQSVPVPLKPSMEPVYGWGAGCVDRVEINGNRAVLSGSVKYSLVTVGDGEVSLEESTVPLRYECDSHPGYADGDMGDMLKKCSVTVEEMSFRKNGDTADLTAELSISAVALTEAHISPVTEIKSVRGEAVDASECTVRIYIPDRGETDWDVEKRFKLKDSVKAEDGRYVF